MFFSPTNSEIAKSLAISWSQIETPKHNSTVRVNTKNGSSYTFDYTDLSGIFDAVRNVFKENGIAIMQNSYTEEGHNGLLACVETMFLHSSGEWAKSAPLKFQVATSMQDFGGQITYMKRYSLSAMLGIATEKDDDANGASGNTYEYANRSNGPSNNSKIPMPKDATEAGQIKISFGKHKGKTLKEIYKEAPDYLKWLIEQEKTDPAIVEGVSLMQVAIAQAEAKRKMEQGG